MDTLNTSVTILPGLSIKLHKHYTESWAPSANIQINSGVECISNVFLPKQDWRSLSAKELSIISSPSSTAEFELFKLPNHLYSQFWSLNIDSITSDINSQSLDKAYSAFADRLTNFFFFIDNRINGKLSVRTEISAPGLRSTGLVHKSAAEHGFRIGNDNRGWILTNFSDEYRALLWLNLSIQGMNELLVDKVPEHTYTNLEKTFSTFFSEFPNYPILRLNLASREGVLITDGLVIYDCDTVSMEGPDICVIINSVNLAET